MTKNSKIKRSAVFIRNHVLTVKDQLFTVLVRNTPYFKPANSALQKIIMKISHFFKKLYISRFKNSKKKANKRISSHFFWYSVNKLLQQRKEFLYYVKTMFQNMQGTFLSPQLV